jgi:hypothetical protein
MLFVSFINDLPDIIPEKSETALYADDTKTFRKITCEDDARLKSNLCCACEVWSPYICSQKTKIERVQRRATRWILKARKGDSSYNERLVDLNLLPLCYDREIKDLMLFYKALYGISDLNVHDYVSFVTHNHSRLCRNPNLLLKTPLCKTTTYQNSYFNRLVKLWNSVCKVAPPNTFSSVKSFKYKTSETPKIDNIFTYLRFDYISVIIRIN